MNKRGYTLVELAITMSLLAGMMAVGTAILVFTLRLNAQTRALRTTQQNTRQAMESMFRQIRLASGFYDSNVLTVPTLQCQLPRGYDPTGPARSDLFIKSSRGEVLEYEIRGGQLVEVNHGRCPSVGSGPSNVGSPLVSALTGNDLEVCELTFIRDNKFRDPDAPNYTNFAPSFLTIRMRVKTPNCGAPADFGTAELTVEESVSLRGEFNNFFQ